MKKLGIIICGLVLVMGCQRNVYRFTEGSVYGTVYHVSYQSEMDYAVEIRQEMERVNRSLSMFNKNSVIAQWNRGESEQVDSLFVAMYEKAREVLSGVVEPIGAVLTLLAAQLVIPALPYLLSFAAGAMLYVVVEELIPEMSQGRHSNLGTVFFAAGFSIMMTLDVALG